MFVHANKLMRVCFAQSHLVLSIVTTGCHAGYQSAFSCRRNGLTDTATVVMVSFSCSSFSCIFSPQKPERYCTTANPSWSAGGRWTKRSRTSTQEFIWKTSARSARSTRSSARPPSCSSASRWIRGSWPRASSRTISCTSEPTSSCP